MRYVVTNATQSVIVVSDDEGVPHSLGAGQRATLDLSDEVAAGLVRALGAGNVVATGGGGGGGTSSVPYVMLGGEGGGFVGDFSLAGDTSLVGCVLDRNNFDTITLAGCTSLTYLSANGNGEMSGFNIDGCSQLRRLEVSSCNLQALDVRDRTLLKHVGVSNNNLETLDCSGCSSLTTLFFAGNPLTDVSVSGCSSLTFLRVSSDIETLDCSGCSSLATLNVANHSLEELDLSGCVAMLQLQLTGNRLATLDVSGCAALTTLNVASNGSLTTLDVSGCEDLTTLECNDNDISALALGSLTQLKYVNAEANALTALDVSNCISLTTLHAVGNGMTSLTLHHSGGLSLNALSILDVADNSLATIDLSTVNNLSRLFLTSNLLTTLDASGLANLHSVALGDNPLEHVDVSGTHLFVLDASGCPTVQYINCGNNVSLDALDVTGLVDLTTVACSGTSLTAVDVSTAPAVRILTAGHALLSSSAVNDILVALDGFGLTGGVVSTQSQDTPAPPSGAGAAAKISLQGKGWTVTTD